MTDLFKKALALHRDGNTSAAMELYVRVLEADPNHVPALTNMASGLKSMGLYSQADACFRRGLEVDPHSPDLNFNFANLLRETGRRQEALEHYRQAIRVKPAMAMAHHNLAYTLQELGLFEEAEGNYRHALGLDPHNYNGWLNLGDVQEQQGKLVAAAATYRHMVETWPERHEALSNLGLIEQVAGRAEAALSLLQRALAMTPTDNRVASNILVAQQYHPLWSDQAIRHTAVSYGARFGAATFLPAQPLPAGRRLRIGYVSADFCQHVAGLLARDVVSRHDLSRFEIFFYSNIAVADHLTQGLRRFGTWRDIAGKPDDVVHTMIRNDGIDILVDLSGHTQGNRLPLFARRAAPVQISWLGYFATTGVRDMDYVIMDPVHAPAGVESLFTERVIRLPHNRFCYTPVDFAPAVSPPPFLRNGYVTFGSFNNSAKINEHVIAAWARILTEVPDSRLILKWRSYADSEHVARLCMVFAGHGVAQDRLEFRPQSTHDALLEEYADIDIALDPFPFSGGYTSLEALWMGVPIVTLPLSRPVSRQTLSFLNSISLGGLAARDLDHYVELARRLAASSSLLQELRGLLRDRMRASPLCDAAGFTRHLEQAYCQAWDEMLARSDKRQQAVREHEGALRLFAQGKMREAEQRLRHALALNDDEAVIHANLGIVLKQLNAVPAERIACYRAAIDRDPTNTSYLRYLASALSDDRQYEEALTLAERAVNLDPGQRDSWFCVGTALAGLKRWRDASSIYGRLATENPGWLDAQFAAGEAWRQVGNMKAALRCFIAARDLMTPDTSAKDKTTVRLAIGAAQIELIEFLDAIETLRDALTYDPDSVPVLTDLGNALKALHRLDEAEAAYGRATELRPDIAGVHCNLGTIYQLRSQYGDAIECYRRALAIQPDMSEALSNLGTCMTYAPETGPQDILNAYRAYDRLVAQKLRDPRPFRNDRSPGRRLRVGYVSADFRRHAVAYFALPLLERHDPANVEIFCYYSHRQADNWTEAFKRRADHWRHCPHLTTEEMAEQIRVDGIDILVDLSGHTLGNRLKVFACKPAPVQVTWMGYVTTTGLSAMDWRVTHHDADPVGTEGDYSERLWRLPGTMWCYRPLPDMPDPSPAPCLQTGRITFGSLNRFSKNSRQVLITWARILQRVADSHLVICVPEGSQRAEVQSLFAAEGIAPDRLRMFAGLDHQSFWKLHGDIDIALDPFPFGGGTTTCETLWLGVPLVTLTGADGKDFPPRFASRMGLAFLSSLGMPELAAPNLEAYIDTAVSLAGDVPRLAALRGELRERMAKAPLTDEVRFAREMEQAYRAMWQDWLNKIDGVQG